VKALFAETTGFEPPPSRQEDIVTADHPIGRYGHFLLRMEMDDIVAALTSLSLPAAS
jgi:hypothetical protein